MGRAVHPESWALNLCLSQSLRLEPGFFPLPLFFPPSFPLPTFLSFLLSPSSLYLSPSLHPLPLSLPLLPPFSLWLAQKCLFQSLPTLPNIHSYLSILDPFPLLPASISAYTYCSCGQHPMFLADPSVWEESLGGPCLLSDAPASVLYLLSTELGIPGGADGDPRPVWAFPTLAFSACQSQASCLI